MIHVHVHCTCTCTLYMYMYMTNNIERTCTYTCIYMYMYMYTCTIIIYTCTLYICVHVCVYICHHRRMITLLSCSHHTASTKLPDITILPPVTMATVHMDVTCTEQPRKSLRMSCWQDDSRLSLTGNSTFLCTTRHITSSPLTLLPLSPITPSTLLRSLPPPLVGVAPSLQRATSGLREE